MSRWTSSSNETEAAQPSILLVTLVDLDFVGGHVRAHDGLGSLTFGGNTYLGVGVYGSVDQVGEDLEIGAKGLKLTLSGIPADLTPDIFTETNYQGRAATLYVGLVDRETNAFVDTPEEVWSGKMDYLEVTGDAARSTVTLYVEDELRSEATAARYSDESQQAIYPGDTFFAQLSKIPKTRVTWGQRPVLLSGSGGGGRPGGGREGVRP